VSLDRERVVNSGNYGYKIKSLLGDNRMSCVTQDETGKVVLLALITHMIMKRNTLAQRIEQFAHVSPLPANIKLLLDTP
jgi:hypothetical protein